MDADRRHELRRNEDRDILIDHSARLGRLERDVTQLSEHVDREIDAMDLRYPTFDRVAKDYVPRSEHHQTSSDRRNTLVLWIAIASPFLTALASQLFHHHP